MMTPLFLLLGLPSSHSLNVFAAASLQDGFRLIASRFEAEHPGVKVVTEYAGSQQLAAQIRLGAPADVFASAGPEPLRQLGIPESRWTYFVSNRLVIASTGKVSEVRDLSRPMRLVIADRRVPVGNYTLAFLEKAGRRFGAAWKASVERNVVSRENDVRSVLAKVELKEADAGIVYSSDVYGRKGIHSLPIPADLSVLARYPAVALPGSHEPKLAREFVEFLVSQRAQKLLRQFGFMPPGPKRK